MEKKNNVTPVRIKDSMEQTENNRPISLLCIISNDLGSCVCITLNNYVKQFTSPLQHDFLRNRLLHYTTAIYLNAIGQNLKKIFKHMLSTWTWIRLSIPLISKLCFKSSNDMVRKAARFFGLQIT